MNKGKENAHSVASQRYPRGKKIANIRILTGNSKTGRGHFSSRSIKNFIQNIWRTLLYRVKILIKT